MKKKLTLTDIQECSAKFNIKSYLPFYIYTCYDLIGFEGKDVFDIGGRLPEEFVLGYLNVRSYTSIEAPNYITNPIDNKDKNYQHSEYNFNNNKISRYNVIYDFIEELSQDYYQNYDLIISFAAFEHINKFPKALDKMFLSLRDSGYLFSMFSPLWSAFDGHHQRRPFDIKGNVLNSPIPPWGHLLMRPPELCQYLYKITDKESADQIVYRVYNSDLINRFFTEDYLNFFQQSSFKIKQCHLTYQTNIEPKIQKKLETLYPGRKYFANNGIMVIMQKDKGHLQF